MKPALFPAQLALVLTLGMHFGQTRTPATPSFVTPTDSARHVLQRLAWGPRPGQIDRVVSEGSQAWIDRQLAMSTTDDPARRELDSRRPSLRASTPDLLAALTAARSRQAAGDTAGARPTLPPPGGAPTLRATLADYATLTLARQVGSEHQLAEVLADFWANHFNVFIGKGLDRALLRDHIEQAIRPRVFGRFEDLLTATATSPAMLFYLDNARSIAVPRGGPDGPGRGINENYARELLELHTLGVDGGYTQDDVIDVARALTGWSLDPRTGTFRFAARAHDRGRKRILGVDIAPGGGIEDGQRVLQLLANHPATSRHISGKLCARLVADDPPPACVDAAVRAWRATDGSIREVVRAIVSTDAFWAEASAPTKFKSPHEFLVSALRALAIDPARAPRLLQALETLGQPLYQQTAPTGWPERASEWASSSALLARMNVGLELVGGRIPGARPDRVWLSRLSTDATRLLAQLDHEILGGTMGPTTRRAIATQLDAIADPTLARERALGLILGSPEFQRQ